MRTRVSRINQQEFRANQSTRVSSLVKFSVRACRDTRYGGPYADSNYCDTLLLRNKRDGRSIFTVRRAPVTFQSTMNEILCS